MTAVTSVDPYTKSIDKNCRSQHSFLFVCVEVLWPSQPNGVMLSMVNLPNRSLLCRLSSLSS